MEQIKQYWLGLQPRERLILGVGGIIVCLILLYALIIQPWHNSLKDMQAALPKLREDLVWMRQQSDALKGGSVKQDQSSSQGQDDSLLSLVEKTAKSANVSKSIQQLSPAENNTEVRVVLEDVNFNQWLRWIDELYKRYGVDVKQVNAERDDDEPNVAEIRVTFVR